MEKNPYNEFLSIIKETSKSNITENKLLNIGIVVSPLPNLIIKTSEIELDKDNLMIDVLIIKFGRGDTTIPHKHIQKENILIVVEAMQQEKVEEMERILIQEENTLINLKIM